MRIGFNPHKDQLLEKSEFKHQIVMPVYIPKLEGYFEESLKILELSLESLFRTTHHKTFFSIINNGSCERVRDYLEKLYKDGFIHELVHTTNIGKLNAILKGLAGSNIELVTITDADVLFSTDWQLETAKVFKTFPKVGVVGVVPQFNMFKSNCGNVIFDNFFNKNLKFLPIKSPEALEMFYKSIGWDESYNKDLLKYSLGIKNKKTSVLLGSGHFVATYKKQQFCEMKSFLDYKLGGDSEAYLDNRALEFDYWRVTTQENYAYHMGNSIEDWMLDTSNNKITNHDIIAGFPNKNKLNKVSYFFKNKIFYKLILSKWFSKLFYKWKGLPKVVLKNFDKLVVE